LIDELKLALLFLLFSKWSPDRWRLPDTLFKCSFSPHLDKVSFVDVVLVCKYYSEEHETKQKKLNKTPKNR